jgi:hypothetical protein
MPLQACSVPRKQFDRVKPKRSGRSIEVGDAIWLRAVSERQDEVMRSTVVKLFSQTIRCAHLMVTRRLLYSHHQLYVDSITDDESSCGHPFAGYYLPYPDEAFEGLVSTITEQEPILNWIYVDQQTFEVKYGIRADAQPHLHGPWDCTRQDRRLTFEGWEGFCAVEDSLGAWAVYFDRDDNGLRGKVPAGTPVLEIELRRVEKTWKKDPEARQQEQGTIHQDSESAQTLLEQQDDSCTSSQKQGETVLHEVKPECVALPLSPIPEKLLSNKLRFWEALSQGVTSEG